MIPKELLKKIRHIEIRTKRLVNDLFSGEYHSTFKGQGMEFEEVRQYQPGDDIRLIDWNVTARTGFPYVKKFREERELSVVILVDASSSGRFGTRERFKSDTAAELTALLAFSAIKNNDKVGLIIFTDRIEKFIPPQKGRSHVPRLIRELLYFSPRAPVPTWSARSNTSTRLSSVVGCFPYLDFLSDGDNKPLQLSNRKHDVIAIKVGDPREAKFENVGLIELEDAETGEIVLINTASRQFRREFEARATEDDQNLKRDLRRINIDMIKVQTDQSYIGPLVQFFRMREKRH
jgi:uncharacterized protein (DUF58 family)